MNNIYKGSILRSRKILRVTQFSLVPVIIKIAFIELLVSKFSKLL